MSSTNINIAQLSEAIRGGRFRFATGKDIIKGTTPKNNIHHGHTLVPENGGPPTSKFGIELPPLVYSHITKQIPKNSKYAVYFMHGDIYGKWPLGQNRGEDPKGDELFDLFRALEDNYGVCLNEDDETKKAIVVFTDQEKVDRTGAKLPINDIMDHIGSIISYPVYRDGHPMEKQRDLTKSPTFKIRLWDAKITPQNEKQIRNDSLCVNVDPEHPDTYLQIIYTKIYDRRQNIMSNAYLSDEEQLDRFTYVAGDSSRGKSPSSLLAIVTILPPSWYWGSKENATLQFKASSIEIYKQTIQKRADYHTPDQLIARFQAAQAALKEYGLDAQQDDDTDLYDNYTQGFGSNNGDDDGNGNGNNNNNDGQGSPSRGVKRPRVADTSATITKKPRTMAPMQVYNRPAPQQQQQQQQGRISQSRSASSGDDDGDGNNNNNDTNAANGNDDFSQNDDSMTGLEDSQVIGFDDNSNQQQQTSNGGSHHRRHHRHHKSKKTSSRRDQDETKSP